MFAYRCPSCSQSLYSAASVLRNPQCGSCGAKAGAELRPVSKPTKQPLRDANAVGAPDPQAA